MKRGGDKRTLVGIVLGAGLVVAIVLAGVTAGFGSTSVPEGDVAVIDADINVPEVVEDGRISQEAFDRSLELATRQSGQQEVPQPGSEQYDQVKEQAMGLLLDIAWIKGEADERGIEVTDTEVQQEFQSTKDENFENEKEYQQFLEESGLTEPEILQRVELQLISEQIQQAVSEGTEPTESDAREFYEGNKEQFEQPEQRTIRIVQNEDAAQVEQAADQLKQDNSPASWKKVAAQSSTDANSKDQGGVREAITPGVFEQPLDDEIFGASEGEVVGPISTERGSYVFQVDSITEASTQPFEEAQPQIQQQLAGQLQQFAFNDFLADYRDRWTELTVCADGYVIERCENFTGSATPPCPDPSLPEEQQQQQLEQTGCPAPVLSNSPAAPGSITPLTPAAGGAPQGPHPPGEDQAAPQLPGGAVPGGAVPGGAAPGGAAPGGAAPGGAAPGGAAPGGAAPPPG
jgi:parvulin-like peptidyl-prolyl isomerase